MVVASIRGHGRKVAGYKLMEYVDCDVELLCGLIEIGKWSSNALAGWCMDTMRSVSIQFVLFINIGPGPLLRDKKRVTSLRGCTPKYNRVLSVLYATALMLIQAIQ